jgi:1-deoxy-D-xylulose-5-phosphate reductoisomerase
MTTRLAILGSTGSIGRQTLDIVRSLPERFSVVAIAAGENLPVLEAQVNEFRPQLVSTSVRCSPDRFAPSRAVHGDEGLTAVATHPDADIVVIATSGHSAIVPTLEAISSGKEIALANKEVVVCAGELLMLAAKQAGISIRPVDSEHSAIWQCLMARGANNEIASITLTASGGALRDVPVDDLPTVTALQALAHPNWKMGPKVTIDSATMINKGLEVIEAHWLFDVPFDQIDVVIHPQSLVHSLVTYRDGSTMAQLGVPDMRVPIQYALTYPARIPAPDRALNIADIGALEFRKPEMERYPGLSLCYEAGRAGSTYPTVLSAADEVAVESFLKDEIPYGALADVIRHTIDLHRPETRELSLRAIHEADEWARRVARKFLGRYTH